MELNRIYRMNCLEGLKELKDNSIDMVLTDPPYNVGKKYGPETNDIRKEKDYYSWYEEIFSELFRVMRNGYLYVSCTSKQIFKIKPLLEKIGFEWVQLLIWYRPNMVGGTCMIRLPWSQMFEPILMFKKGPRIKMLNQHMGYLTHDVMVHSAPQSNFLSNRRYHPTQKPIKLYKQIIARTPGKLVLDPFIGSGTTAIACKTLGRDFIGFEINPVFVKIAEKRIHETLSRSNEKVILSRPGCKQSGIQKEVL